MVWPFEALGRPGLQPHAVDLPGTGESERSEKLKHLESRGLFKRSEHFEELNPLEILAFLKGWNDFENCCPNSRGTKEIVFVFLNHHYIFFSFIHICSTFCPFSLI
jgi:hypothetical protein